MFGCAPRSEWHLLCGICCANPCVLGGGEEKEDKVSGCLGSMGLVEGIHGNLKVGWVGSALSCQFDRIRICGC